MDKFYHEEVEKQDFLWDRVVSIKYVGEEGVYDIEVEGTHNFVGNDIVAHNTFITGRTGINTTAPSTTFEVQGTASASYFLTGNTLQVGGFASAAYNRFGTNATTHALSASNDVLISGKLEVDGPVFFDGGFTISGASSSGNFDPALDNQYDLGD
ncbi:MAG: hypothetical protein HYT64_00015, partial [Candidatus Yanofskybacteria bacterium]|nr:hypothetical protein [Candidatus Yanofskybacteria bacterium]